MYRVTCRVVTESSVTLSVGNGPSLSNPFPATAVAQLPFLCAVPVGLQIKPNVSRSLGSSVSNHSLPTHAQLKTIFFSPYTLQVLKPSKLPIPCPLHADDSSSIPVSSAGILDLLVSVSDAQGRSFHNFSSLDFQWTISDTSLAVLPDPPALKTVDTPDASKLRDLLEVYYGWTLSIGQSNVNNAQAITAFSPLSSPPPLRTQAVQRDWFGALW